MYSLIVNELISENLAYKVQYQYLHNQFTKQISFLHKKEYPNYSHYSQQNSCLLLFKLSYFLISKYYSLPNMILQSIIPIKNQFYFYFMKGSTRNKIKTQPVSKQELDKMILLAADEKLLPQLIWDFDKRNKSNQLIKNYQKSVKKIYTEETSSPLKYNPEEALSHRQKFRQKVLKLLAHQLPIDYLKAAQIDNERVMTYKGQPLQKVQYSTKKEYKMFRDFSEANFRKKYNNIFQEKLEFQHRNVFQSVRKPKKSHAVTCPTQIKDISTFQHSPITNQSLSNIDQKQQSEFILPKLIIRKNFTDKSRLATSPTTYRYKKPRKVITKDEQSAVIEQMRKIGGYSENTTINGLSLTKESIIRYLKQFYQRPSRIVDFLSLSSVESYETFKRLPHKLKLMQNQHLYFMIFLFYDSNNDGYICNQDLMKLSQMGKKCPLIEQDSRLLRANAHKVKFQDDLPYKELYRVPDLTQTKFFNWHKKFESKEHQQPSQQKIQIKKYFGHLNRKSILIHFEGFKKIYNNEKPFLWYDILWRLCGVGYEGLHYS